MAAVKEAALPAILPSGFSDIPALVYEECPTPYVKFLHPMGKNFANITSACKAKEGDPVLIWGSQYIRLVPFRYFLVSACEFWAKYGESGAITEAVRSQPAGWSKYAGRNSPWGHTIDTMVIAIRDNELIPATCRFKTTKTDGAILAVKAAQECQTPAWAERGAEYAFSLKSPQPYSRFTVYVEPREVSADKGGKTTKYQKLDAQIHATTAPQYELLAKFWKGLDREENEGLYEAVKAEYKRRLEQVKEKMIS